MKRNLLSGAVGLALFACFLVPTFALAAGPRSDGFRLQAPRPLENSYVGRTGVSEALVPEVDTPLSLASADLDEDGAPDLVCGYGSVSGGRLVVHRTNPASIMSPPRLAGDPPKVPYFLSPARVFDLPAEPSFLGTGDFDADGHWDVVAATRGDGGLYLLAGDGSGELAEPRRVELPGRVTALITGDVNRRDGLTDVIVGIDEGAGPAVLVFESPRGALSADPEILPLPYAPVTLALGHLDGEASVDLAVGAGSDVWIVRGRDRKLSLDSIRRAVVGPALFEAVTLPAPVASVVSGDFVTEPGAYVEELAVLDRDGTLHLLERDASEAGAVRWLPLVSGPAARPAETPSASSSILRARLSGAGEELLVIDRQDHSLSVYSAGPRQAEGGGVALNGGHPSQLESAPVTAISMRLNGDALGDLVVLNPETTVPSVYESAAAAIFTVTKIGDTGTGSIRKAVQDANSSPGADLIDFNIPGAPPHTIDLQFQIDVLTEAVTIDGYTQPGAAPNTVPAPGLTTAVIGVGIDGTLAGLGEGLQVNGGSTTIRGVAVSDWGVDGEIGPGNGIVIQSDGNIIEGCYVGTDVTGLMTDDNEKNGIQLIDSANNTIGGTLPGARNIISANGDDGLDIRGVGSSGNVVRGNFIGSDATGLAALGNGGETLEGDGIQLQDASSNTIGGTVAGAPNLWVANATDGIDITGSGHLVQGNMVGVFANGLAVFPDSANGDAGIQAGGQFHTIGGTTLAARNHVSGNVQGVMLTGTANQVQVQGNLIGPDASGIGPAGNRTTGVNIRGGGNTIGGVAPGAGNVISGNLAQGVLINLVNASGNQVQGNFIGLDETGGTRLSNAGDGVSISDAANNTIGGLDVGAGNVISGNGDDGVQILAPGATGNLVQGNLIGTDPTGTIDLGNAADGVYIANSWNNTIGGDNFAAGNFIAGNDGTGILLQSLGTGNRLTGNYIFANTLLGIDLDAIGVLPNDPGDIDNGPNGKQNYPVITAADIDSSSMLSISGDLYSTGSTAYRIELFSNASCDPSGHGEGELLIATKNVTTDVGGTASFTQDFSSVSFVPGSITATATDSFGNTSEFSACMPATCVDIVTMGTSFMALDPDTMGWGAVQDVVWAKGDVADRGPTYPILDSGSIFGSTTMSISSDAPVAFQSFYYLVRPFLCGTWLTQPATEPARDVYLP